MSAYTVNSVKREALQALEVLIICNGLQTNLFSFCYGRSHYLYYTEQQKTNRKKKTCSLLQIKLTSLSFEPVHYTYIFEKLFWSKGHLHNCSQNVKKCRKPTNHCLTTINAEGVRN